MEIGYAKILEITKEKIPVRMEGEFIPSVFFKTDKGLYVDSDFTSRIVNKASSVDADTEYEITSLNLRLSANDATIESALPEKHIFSETEVSAIVGNLIENQPEGKEGTLLNDGSWNIFYTPDFVVHVHWSSYSSRWYVDAWHRHDGGWDEGSRVFSPAN